jgi:hypothetical protein
MINDLDSTDRGGGIRRDTNDINILAKIMKLRKNPRMILLGIVLSLRKEEDLNIILMSLQHRRNMTNTLVRGISASRYQRYLHFNNS